MRIYDTWTSSYFEQDQAYRGRRFIAQEIENVAYVPFMRDRSGEVARFRLEGSME